MVLQFIRKHDLDISGEKLHAIYIERFGRDYEYKVGRDKKEMIVAENNLNVRKPRRKPLQRIHAMVSQHILIS